MRWTVLIAGLMLAACGSTDAADVAAIQEKMHVQFDRPDVRLDAGPVIVSGDHAVADWTQGDMGGRALFRRNGGEWTIMLCSGDALRDAVMLQQARVPASDAKSIARKLADAEGELDPHRLALMSKFFGTVRAEDMPGYR